jgi:TetR/AcrR family transcriptional repressor of mexJK operon
MTKAEKASAAVSVDSGANGRRLRRPSLSHDEFLSKALDVFYEKGFEGASIAGITSAAGIAKRTVYARYGDKENLFKAAIERAIDDWNMPVERLREAETESLEESLLAIGQMLIENILTPSGLRLIRLTNAESGRLPTLGEHNVRYGQDPIIAYLADLFRRKLPAGEHFVDAEDSAEAFLHLVVGGPANAAAWGVVKDKDAIARRARLSTRIFLRGLLSVSGSWVSMGELTQVKQELAELKALLGEASGRIGRASERLTLGNGTSNRQSNE